MSATEELYDDLEELASAEEFLDYFDIAFDRRVVQVNRLHILQRYHDYLATVAIPDDDLDAARTIFHDQLERAYNDFVGSSAAEQKALRIYKAGQPQVAKISLDSISVRGRDDAPAF